MRSYLLGFLTLATLATFPVQAQALPASTTLVAQASDSIEVDAEFARQEEKFRKEIEALRKQIGAMEKQLSTMKASLNSMSSSMDAMKMKKVTARIRR